MMLKRITGPSTFFYKWLFPLLFFGFLCLFVSIAFFGPPARPRLVFLVPPLLMLVFGYLLMRKLVWDLADEVWDGGDHLVVVLSGQRETVPLANIMNVSASTLINPPRITLRLIHPGRLGQEIIFSPPRNSLFNPFARNTVADDLTERVFRARSAR